MVPLSLMTRSFIVSMSRATSPTSLLRPAQTSSIWRPGDSRGPPVFCVVRSPPDDSGCAECLRDPSGGLRFSCLHYQSARPDGPRTPPRHLYYGRRTVSMAVAAAVGDDPQHPVAGRGGGWRQLAPG